MTKHSYYHQHETLSLKTKIFYLVLSLEPKYLQAQDAIVLLTGKIPFSLTEEITNGPFLDIRYFAFPSPKDFGEICNPKYPISSTSLLIAVLGIFFG